MRQRPLFLYCQFLVAATAQEGFFSRSEEHTSELQSHVRISYAVFCLKKKKKKKKNRQNDIAFEWWKLPAQYFSISTNQLPVLLTQWWTAHLILTEDCKSIIGLFSIHEKTTPMLTCPIGQHSHILACKEAKQKWTHLPALQKISMSSHHRYKHYEFFWETWMPRLCMYLLPY